MECCGRILSSTWWDSNRSYRSECGKSLFSPTRHVTKPSSQTPSFKFRPTITNEIHTQVLVWILYRRGGMVLSFKRTVLWHINNRLSIMSKSAWKFQRSSVSATLVKHSQWQRPNIRVPRGVFGSSLTLYLESLFMHEWKSVVSIARASLSRLSQDQAYNLMPRHYAVPK